MVPHNFASHLEHHHLVIQAWIRHPLHEPKDGIAWFHTLIKRIGMTLLLEPQAVCSEMEKNKGLTVVAVITTSHISMHIWDEQSPAEMQLDVYSCKSYEKEIIFNLIKETMDPISIRYKFINRSTGLHLYNEDHS